ncbi:MAG TPA: hypothetical protein VID19_03115 [Candidatus Eremiobacteraceae bacterium]|jgi:hypothetical protein
MDTNPTQLPGGTPAVSSPNAVESLIGHPATIGEALNNLAMHIPGFAGYKSSEDRRIADKQLRAVIGERLSKVKDRLDRVVDALSRSGNLDSLAIIDQSGRKLERLIDRMRFADYGYTAVFDRVQLGDAQLLQIYQFDATIMGELPQFDGAVATIESAGADGEKVRGGIVSFDALVDDFDKRFEGRQHLFDGLATP